MILRPPVWVIDLAARFWVGVRELPPSFPRDLTTTLAWLPNIQVTELPHLTLARAVAFLARAGVPFRHDGPDRPLRGCLAAFANSGHILLDSTDDEAERRFTLAHELAHFLRDYSEPRRRVIARFGNAVLEVLDGKRLPTLDERLAGVFCNATLGCHHHLLDRNHGKAQLPAVQQTEDAADQLAFELLAPFSEVCRLTSALGCPESLIACLISKFGLPPLPAAQYAKNLHPSEFSQKV